MFEGFIKELHRHLLARQEWTERDYHEILYDLKIILRNVSEALPQMEREARRRYPDYDFSDPQLPIEEPAAPKGEWI